MTALDNVLRYSVDRPLASAMVPMRAVCRLNCSVVNAVSAIWRASGSLGSSMPTLSHRVSERREREAAGAGRGRGWTMIRRATLGLLVIVVATLAVSGCSGVGPGRTASGKVATKHLDASGVTRLDVAYGFDVRVTLGKPEAAT